VSRSIVTRRSEVCAILEDPRFEVPAAAPAADGINWVRATVSRFSNGSTHARRRALVERELEQLDPAVLRNAARRAALKTTDERNVPLIVLCTALGVGRRALPNAVADARTVAAAYPLDSSVDPLADAAANRLVALLGPTRDERTAARIALLAQATIATAALIESALEVRRADPARPAQEVLTETISRHPPVVATRRIGPDGRGIVLDLATADLTFGHGRRSCPGREHALALAAGVLDAAAQTDQ
jgi:hypothetical protein